MTENLAVELCSLSKSFGSVQANADISLKVKKASIHAIVGENGAGKSTAMNMLYGLYAPDAGKILVDGVEQKFSFPSDALAVGLGMIHQHFSLSGPETVLDNIVLGAEPLTEARCMTVIPKALRFFNRSFARKKLEKIVAQYGLHVDWNAKVETLPVGLKQRVEILKLLYREARILILDEPTAVLTPQEIDQFFKNLRDLRDQGKTILIITHKLREVLSLSDEVTVFRAGRIVGHRRTSETNEEDLAQLMVGRKIDLHSKPLFLSQEKTSTVLDVKNVTLKLNSRTVLENLNFSVYPGEVVGIAGVQGNGQSEFEKLLLDPRAFFSSGEAKGEISLRGHNITQLTTSELFKKGMAFVCEDRLKEGLIASASLDQNFLLGLHHFARFCQRGKIRWKEVQSATLEAIKNFEIKAPGFEIPAGSLSGGNQQKLIVARELCKNPEFLLISQPTRGVDIGAIEFIHNKIRERQKAGAGILVISSELSEILSLANRILVFFEGKIVAEFKSSEATESKLGLAMGGAAA